MNFSKHLKKQLTEMSNYYEDKKFYFISHRINDLLKLDTRDEVCKTINELNNIIRDMYNSIGDVRYTDFLFIKRLYRSVVVKGKYYNDTSK